MQRLGGFIATDVVLRSISLFALAGICEIGGGYRVWLWLRDERGWIDGRMSDRFDMLGGALCLMRVAVIMYWTRAA